MNETVATGWQSSPDGRGTFDILKSCGITILLCCWTAVQPNVGAIQDRWAESIRDKAGMTCIALTSPEFILFHAGGQRDTARESVKAFKAKGIDSWTMKKAFYANMGGFRLVAPDHTFPVDSQQLLFLIDKKYIELPDISDEDIDDKNKADNIARLLTLLQAGWFLVNTISRVIQKLAVTTLELTTISFIVVTFTSSYMWMQKPMDVHRSIPISSSTTTEEMRREAGVQGPWMRSPLDFVSQYDSEPYLYWQYANEISHKWHLPVFERKITSRPWDRIPHINFRNAALKTDILCGTVTVGFGAILVLGWEFHFPTETERILWRISTVYNVFFGVVSLLLIGVNKYIPWFRKRYQQASIDAENGAANPRTRWQRYHASMRNNSSPRDPTLTIPVRYLIPITTLSVLYCFARTFILLEDAIGLRALPASTFETVKWSNYVPHF